MKVHGGDVHRAAQETGIPISDIIDFSASINPLGMPGSVVAAIRESIPLLVHYPDPFADGLARRIAAWQDVDPRSVLCGNGSTELIYLLVRALAPRRVLIPEPAFSEYERACAMHTGTVCRPLRLSPEKGFAIDPEQFIRAMEGCDMAFLCNPNNPTGAAMSREQVLSLARAAARQCCYLIVDEAFIDFLPGQSVVREAEADGRLIVLRSLTKFYALSGLRIGYAVLPPATAATVRKHKEPWTVNTLAHRAAETAIGEREYQNETMTLITEEKQYLEQSFRDRGIEFFPSQANFYLLRNSRGAVIVPALRKKGILVRDCSNFAGLDSSYLRVAVRLRRENERLLKELAALCAA